MAAGVCRRAPLPRRLLRGVKKDCDDLRESLCRERDQRSGATPVLDDLVAGLEGIVERCDEAIAEQEISDEEVERLVGWALATPRFS